MIDQLISIVSQKLGIDAGTAEKAVGTVMSILRNEGDASSVNALFDQVPGSADLADKFASHLEQGGGGLMGAVGGLLGGKAEDILDSMGALKGTGLSMDQLGDMLPAVQEFLAGEDRGELVEQALASVPALKNLLG